MKRKSDDVPPTFGGKLKALRQKAGWSQEQLAAASRTSTSTIQKIERGITPHPHYTTLLGIAEALGVDYEDLAIMAGRPTISGALTGSEMDEIAEQLAERLGPRLVDEIRRLMAS